jgi:hypothetical protein
MATPQPIPDAASDPLGAVLGGTAAWYRRRFAMRNCRVGGGAVHAVRMVTWVGGTQVPAPACHVGIGGWDLTALEPSTQPVTCRRCLRLRDDDTAGDGPVASPVQLPLY